VNAAAVERISYREALRRGLREALAADPRVFLMGEDVGRYGGCFAVTKGLLAEFGEQRVRDTPLSESAFVGAGIGAALAGMRPIVEIMTVNFSLLALDQIVNTAATLRHMSGGQFGVPVVIRMATGAGRQLAAQHSHSLEAWYAHVPGLRVVEPGTVADARGVLRAALASADPVIVFEPIALYNMEGELDPAADAMPLEGVCTGPAATSRWSATAPACGVARLPPTGLRASASRPRSSTCAACGRSTRPRCSTRCAARGAR
jgi:pyruvate dehydrogenase E1 component beta subunit